MYPKYKITVVGTGYVGMSMAALLGQHNGVIALDIDGARVAYFSDTRRRKIFLQKLCEDTGSPKGDPSVFIDLSPDLKPDGAVIDS